MKNTRKTAAADYSQRAAIAKDLLKRIAGRLSEHQARHAARPGDWDRDLEATVGGVQTRLNVVLTVQ